MSRYSGYKQGTNARGFRHGTYTTPDPKHIANAAADTSTEVGRSFAQVCKNATERISQLREEGDRRALGLPEEVKPTARQYRRYRNGHGVAYEFSRS